MSVFIPNHIHFLATVTLEKPNFTVPFVHDWLYRLVQSAGMTVLAGPYVVECNDPGNEGITGGVFLKESHSTIHIWDKKDEPYLKMDLYSCKKFNIKNIIEMIKELNPRFVHYQVIDRNHPSEMYFETYNNAILSEETLRYVAEDCKSPHFLSFWI
jgi:S-adenosylmethionine/arginine decarboxylase-like enzyme